MSNPVVMKINFQIILIVFLDILHSKVPKISMKLGNYI